MDVFVIAEAGVNHNGEREMALALVDAAADAGADAVKFLTFKADAVISAGVDKAEYQKQATDSGESQLEMLQRLELSHDLHHQLFDHCREKGIRFLLTPFDAGSLRFFVDDLKLDTLKIPSGEITNGPHLLQAGESGCDIILSTGMSTLDEVAEALGTTYKDRHTGNHGLLAALSFNGKKTITTGGGAILNNDSDIAAKAKHLTTTAKVPHKWEYGHDRVGFNYRLPNINAALGCAQMEQLPRFLEQKRRLADTYANAFADVEGVRFFTEPDFAKSNYWLNVLLLDADAANLKDDILKATNDNGFMTRPAWMPLHHLPMYVDCPKMDLSVAEDLYRRIINIPSSQGLVKA